MNKLLFGQFNVSAMGFLFPKEKLMTVSMIWIVLSQYLKQPPSFDIKASILYLPVPLRLMLSDTLLLVPSVFPDESITCQLTLRAEPPLKFLILMASLLQPL